MGTQTWQIKSSSRKGFAAAVGSLLVGLLFIWLTWRLPAHDSNVTAAMWLGVLLVGLGLAAIILAEEVVTTVDPEQRSLRMDCKRRMGSVSVMLPFEEVESVNVARVGSCSDGTPSFWLQIQRQGGKVVSTGWWSLSEAEARRLAERLAAGIGCECRGGMPLGSASVGHVAAAAVGAVVLYAVWFRFSVGPWCPAMWFGPAAPVFVLAAFAVLLGLFRRFRA